jgi:hypothetical protein
MGKNKKILGEKWFVEDRWNSIDFSNNCMKNGKVNVGIKFFL